VGEFVGGLGTKAGVNDTFQVFDHMDVCSNGYRRLYFPVFLREFKQLYYLKALFGKSQINNLRPAEDL
jgi:hypothetical protein